VVAVSMDGEALNDAGQVAFMVLGNQGGTEVRAIVRADPISTCTFSLNPTTANHGGSGGGGNLAVTATNGSCTWAAHANDTWLTVTSPSGGTGSAVVNLLSRGKYWHSAAKWNADRRRSIVHGDTGRCHVARAAPN